jgi:DNA-binding NtrC family response regulator
LQQDGGELQVHRLGEHGRHPLDDRRQREERRQRLAETADRLLVAEPRAVEGAVDDVLRCAAQRIEHVREAGVEEGNEEKAPLERKSAAREGVLGEGEGTQRAAVERYESGLVREALRRNGGNRTHTATELGLSRRALIDKLEKYGIR